MENWNDHVVHIMDEVSERLHAPSDLTKDPEFKRQVEHMRSQWKKELAEYSSNPRSFITYLKDEWGEARRMSDHEMNEMREWLILNEEVKGSIREKL